MVHRFGEGVSPHTRPFRKRNDIPHSDELKINGMVLVGHPKPIDTEVLLKLLSYPPVTMVKFSRMKKNRKKVFNPKYLKMPGWQIR
jgi:hypothetical protein